MVLLLRRRWCYAEGRRIQDGRALPDVMIYGKRGTGLGVCEDDSDVILAESGHSGHKWRAERPKQVIAPLAFHRAATSLRGVQGGYLHFAGPALSFGQCSCCLAVAVLMYGL